MRTAPFPSLTTSIFRAEIQCRSVHGRMPRYWAASGTLSSSSLFKAPSSWTVSATQVLHLQDGHFVLSDVRLEVEDQGGIVRTVDLELVTEHYHRGHIGGKSNADFRMFGGGSSGGRGTPRDPHTVGRLLR